MKWTRRGGPRRKPPTPSSRAEATAGSTVPAPGAMYRMARTTELSFSVMSSLVDRVPVYQLDLGIDLRIGSSLILDHGRR